MSHTLKRIAFFYGLCSKWGLVAKSVICCSVFTEHNTRCLCFDEVSYIHSAKIDESSSIRLTLFDSVCKNESSDLIIHGPASGIAYTNCQEEKSLRRCSGSEHTTAQHRNRHALWFGTQKNRASVFLSF